MGKGSTTFGGRLFQFGGTPVGGDLLGLHGKGKIRFIDPDNGDNGQSGKTPERAWETLQYAADQLGYYKANGDMDGYHDIIIRLPGVEEVDVPIRFDGGGVATDPGAYISTVSSLSGLKIWGNVLHAHTRMSDDSVTAATSTVIIVRRGINFYGMSFAGRGTGSRDDGLGACLSYLVDSNVATGTYLGHHQGGNFHTIHGCNFRDDGSNDTTGIYEFGAGACEIVECTFGYYAAARGPVGIVVRGSLTNNPFDINIRNNVFTHCPLGIDWRNATIPGGILVTDNMFTGNTLANRFTSFSCTGRGLYANNRYDVAEDSAAAHTNTGSTNDTAAVTTSTNVEFSGNWYTDDLKPTG